MSVMKRLSGIVQAKANKALDKAENPADMLDLSYEKQMENLTKVRRALADVATARKRLELQATELQGQAQKLQDQAKQALGQGQEDLAREALARRATLADQLESLGTQHQQVEAQQQQLETTATRLQAQVDAFRTKKETLKASYTASKAQASIGEAVSGISESMTDAGMTLDRAQDKIAQMQARAGAIDELLDTGALPDALGGGGDDIQKQLDATSKAGQVDAELAALKAQMGAGTDRAPACRRVRPRAPTAHRRPRVGQRRPRTRGRRRLMIVRILGEGRYDVPDADMPAIEQLDAQLVDALDRGDEAEFAGTLADLIGQVRHTGTLIAPDDLRPVLTGRAARGLDPGRGARPAGRRSLSLRFSSCPCRPWSSGRRARPARSRRARRRHAP